MERKSLWIAAGIICILTFVLILSGKVFAGQTTVIGKVNDSYQIVTEEGTVYEVADTDTGNNMLSHFGKTVVAKGIVTEEEGVKLINVISYTVKE